jgi:L,D-transpeptidase YbiS
MRSRRRSNRHRGSWVDREFDSILLFLVLVSFLVALLWRPEPPRVVPPPTRSVALPEPEPGSTPAATADSLRHAAALDSLRHAAAFDSLRHGAILDSLGVTGPSLFVNAPQNRFWLYDAAHRLLRSGPCSTGSDSTLTAPDGRTWLFSTPRGARHVAHKAIDPVWVKPDWAYVEEGLKPPAPGAAERLVPGVLGAHALDIGDGMFVHGSPVQITIGLPVTHGCVRLLDADLALVYETLAVGDLVYVE